MDVVAVCVSRDKNVRPPLKTPQAGGPWCALGTGPTTVLER